MLNTLKANVGSKKARIRVGRGIGSGKGKTCGRGGKGQTARSGVAINGFEGGQNPLYRRLPKRGFNSLNRISYFPLNLNVLESLVSQGKIDPSNINEDSIRALGLAKGVISKIKLLGVLSKGVVLNIQVSAASNSARASITSAGGVVETQ
jgi:large subunit ribosomal protein L15